MLIGCMACITGGVPIEPRMHHCTNTPLRLKSNLPTNQKDIGRVLLIGYLMVLTGIGLLVTGAVLKNRGDISNGEIAKSRPTTTPIPYEYPLESPEEEKIDEESPYHYRFTIPGGLCLGIGCLVYIMNRGKITMLSEANPDFKPDIWTWPFKQHHTPCLLGIHRKRNQPNATGSLPPSENNQSQPATVTVQPASVRTTTTHHGSLSHSYPSGTTSGDVYLPALLGSTSTTINMHSPSGGPQPPAYTAPNAAYSMYGINGQSHDPSAPPPSYSEATAASGYPKC